MMNPPILNPTRPINPLPTTANKTPETPPPPSPLPPPPPPPPLNQPIWGKSISPSMKGMRVCHWLKE